MKGLITTACLVSRRLVSAATAASVASKGFAALIAESLVKLP